MPTYNEATGNFSTLLSWHVANGTRPPGQKRERWTVKKFGGAVAPATSYDSFRKTFQNWKEGRHVPRSIEQIEIALFGQAEDEPYKTWRRDLEAAHKAA